MVLEVGVQRVSASAARLDLASVDESINDPRYHVRLWH